MYRTPSEGSHPLPLPGRGCTDPIRALAAGQLKQGRQVSKLCRKEAQEGGTNTQTKVNGFAPRAEACKTPLGTIPEKPGLRLPPFASLCADSE